MLQKDFTPPEPSISKQETEKRTKLLEWASGLVRPAVTNLYAAGSMATGRNYSVTPRSDIDIIATVTPETVNNLINADMFPPEELKRVIKGYKSGSYKQFSFVKTQDEVPLEFHFWDEQALTELITYQKESIIRLRSSIDKPSPDYAHSFDGEEHLAELEGYIHEDYPCGDFPGHRIVDGKLYLCRPITNVLALPNAVILNDSFKNAMESCWNKTMQRLKTFADNSGVVDVSKYNIINALPGNNKLSPESRELLRQKTREYLS